jgi:hypothetical protein
MMLRALTIVGRELIQASSGIKIIMAELAFVLGKFHAKVKPQSMRAVAMARGDPMSGGGGGTLQI